MFDVLGYASVLVVGLALACSGRLGHELAVGASLWYAFLWLGAMTLMQPIYGWAQYGLACVRVAFAVAARAIVGPSLDPEFAFEAEELHYGSSNGESVPPSGCLLVAFFVLFAIGLLPLRAGMGYATPRAWDVLLHLLLGVLVLRNRRGEQD